jgi:hypothetical protein
MILELGPRHRLIMRSNYMMQMYVHVDIWFTQVINCMFLVLQSQNPNDHLYFVYAATAVGQK